MYSPASHPYYMAQFGGQPGGGYTQSPLQTCATPQTTQSYGTAGQMHHHCTSHHSPQQQHMAMQAPASCGHDPMLINKIAQAIDGEYTAICCYAQLISQAPSEEERQIITEIRQDEMRHYQTFQKIYCSLTYQNHQPQMIETCPATYVEGVLAAFKDEQKTADTYLEIADSTQDPVIKNSFHMASHDEQNHAVWFLYLQMKHGLSPKACNA